MLGTRHIRQKLVYFLPVFYLVVLVQLLAPIGASAVAAGSLSDPLFGATICASGHDGAPGQKSADPNSDHDACVAYCASALTATSAFENTPPSAVILDRDIRAVVWFVGRQHSPIVRTAAPAQARGPPIFS